MPRMFKGGLCASLLAIVFLPTPIHSQSTSGYVPFCRVTVEQDGWKISSTPDTFSLQPLELLNPVGTYRAASITLYYRAKQTNYNEAQTFALNFNRGNGKINDDYVYQIFSGNTKLYEGAYELKETPSGGTTKTPPVIPDEVLNQLNNFGHADFQTIERDSSRGREEFVASAGVDMTHLRTALRDGFWGMVNAKEALDKGECRA